MEGRAMRVLVAEDSSLLRTQIIRMFSDLNGIEVVGDAQDALEACQAISELKPDVVILDILMRGGNGIEVLRKIKREDCFTVVIVLTNSTAPPYRRRSTEAGAEFFLDKSTEFGKMPEIIERLMVRFSKTLDGWTGGLVCE
jgi:two-component system OmpR family response regulator